MCEATHSTYGRCQPERPARAVRVRGRREAAVDPARHHRHPRRIDAEQLGELRAGELRHGDDPPGARREHRQQPPLPGRVDAGVPGGMAQRGGVVEHEHGAARGRGRQVRRAQQQRRAQPRDPRGQDELLPRVARPGGPAAEAGAGPRRRPGAGPAGARRARAPSAPRRPARGARRLVRRWRPAASARRTIPEPLRGPFEVRRLQCGLIDRWLRGRPRMRRPALLRRPGPRVPVRLIDGAPAEAPDGASRRAAAARPRRSRGVPAAGGREPHPAPAVDLSARAPRAVRRALRPLAPRRHASACSRACATAARSRAC